MTLEDIKWKLSEDEYIKIKYGFSNKDYNKFILRKTTAQEVLNIFFRFKGFKESYRDLNLENKRYLLDLLSEELYEGINENY